ncbi:hypothetical protein B0T11DRAFT_354005 [Plectosphaerella cucumerina]|uniref:Uncharacterized protein n=1 Tax=Plectosphaerella cucumerina TaxID=40658 RepID=A0A8K0THR0_9PEZI|nr:hypothetical protein B0T11DRAFT_354005 [Plectosphaerella cucumerina]
MTPTPTGLFGLLPNELIIAMAHLLPVADVLALKIATRGSLPVLARRIDPSEYLQWASPFSHCDELLEAMATHGAVLSGSRALDYFVPGSTTESSDWDFYVGPVASSVLAVKEALERSGVVFESCLARAARTWRDKSSVTLAQNQIIPIAYEASLAHERSPDSQLVVDAVHRAYPELQDMAPLVRADGSVRWLGHLVPILIDSDGSASPLMPWEPRDRLYPRHVAAKVLAGSARKGAKTASVQLVIGAVDARQIAISEPLLQTVFRSIFSFYGSHVQCLMTKHFALHMYYGMAVEKSAYQWHVPADIREKADAGVRKYVSRGFGFMTAPEGNRWKLRSTQDEESCLVVLDADGRYQPPLSLIQKLRWHHSGQNIRPLLQPETSGARHELLCFGMVSRYSGLR